MAVGVMLCRHTPSLLGIMHPGSVSPATDVFLGAENDGAASALLGEGSQSFRETALLAFPWTPVYPGRILTRSLSP